MLGLVECLVGICFVGIVDIFPYFRTVIGFLRPVQIVLGNDISGIVIFGQGRILPVLLIVQRGLCIDYAGLGCGDRQFGIGDRFGGGQLEQSQLGFLQFILQRGVIQLGQ